MNFLPYIKHLTEARNWRGHGIHSPFAFDLAHNIIPEKNPYFVFDHLQKKAGKQKCSDRKQREMLFRILNNAPSCKHLLVVGGNEADAMYLAAVNSSAVCVFISQTANEDFFLKKGFKNIRVIKTLQEIFSKIQTLDFVLFGKVEEKGITACLQHINQETIFAFWDTYTKNDKNWAFISIYPKAQLKIRTFRLGLIYFNSEIQKGNYTLYN